MDTSEITGLILAGGRGTRMGSVDKGLQPLRGKPMAAYAVEALRPQVGSLYINANQNLETWETFGATVLPDIIPNYAGPLAGIHAGLSACSTPYLVTVPCDSPYFPTDLVQRLAQDLERHEADIAYAITGYGVRRESHPVFALLKASLLPDLTTFLQHDGHKMLAWYATKNMTKVFFEDEDAFRNINTLSELQQLEDQ